MIHYYEEWSVLFFFSSQNTTVQLIPFEIQEKESQRLQMGFLVSLSFIDMFAKVGRF